LVLRMGAVDNPSYQEIVARLGNDLFVKPANSGSSVGVSRATDQRRFEQALADVWNYDDKAVVEQTISGREIECSVMGNEAPCASLPGEIVVAGQFYSYEAKYLSDDAAQLSAPARLTVEQTERVRELAVRAYRAVGCQGMARVDFFLDRSGRLLLNEINTIPGFTKISMYPRMWEASGISYPDLLDSLIELARKRAAVQSSRRLHRLTESGQQS
ncbi:MAG: D-alanine--D-alanine ligase, partial [Negativicutes bacterium]|nr:D-alanine--D-alanine ligase [Negativicutes bacterium]